MFDFQACNAIRLSLASPEQIRSWSYGEVTEPHTLNFRTLKPEKNGLHCERIFGPTKDWACSCGKFRGYEVKGLTCDKCGVEVIRADVRRERMGHIELAAPICHIWYSRGTPSYLGLLLDLSPRHLMGVIYFASYIVTSVDEEARMREIARLTEELEHLPPEPRAAEKLSDQRGRGRRKGRVAGGDERTSAEGREIEVRREQELAAAKGAESRTLGQLREWMDREPDSALVFEPTGRVIVPRGERVAARHLLLLERAGDGWRDAIAEQARNSLEMLAESRRPSAPLSEEAEVDSGYELPGQDLGQRRLQIAQLLNDLGGLQKRALLTERQYWKLLGDYGHLFRAGMGAEAIQELLVELDLDDQAMQLCAQVQATIGQVHTKAARRLRVVEAFRASGVPPACMILTVLPVLPPDLRPVVQLDGGRLATADLNDLYKIVIVRNQRVKSLTQMGAPTIILRNEFRLLQEAVDALFDNGRRGRPLTTTGTKGLRPLKSLASMLKGKQGRFRENLLGKRVDYSGRSVIVVGPELKLHQCGMPKMMVLELFKPFVMNQLVAQHYCANAKSAKRFIERGMPEVWDVLEEVITGHPVLLNRAPTLHRLGIQAFEAVLVEGSAIQLHPLVCSAFNADFDGDQMAVHVPLSLKAQEEARQLLMSTRNLLSPASGEPVIGASQEIVLGCYYLTQDRAGGKGEGRVFTDTTEALLAYELGVIHLQAPIKVRLGDVDICDAPPPALRSRRSSGKPAETTVGRIIFNDVLPEPLRFKNYVMKKENLRQLIAECYRECGRARTVELADEIKRLGFSYATKAGITIAISDVKVPAGKQLALAEADATMDELENLYREGLITDQEKYQQTVQAWNDATEKVTRMVESTLDPYGSIYTIAKSGATKAKFQQIRQLSGMRGLMASPSGRIIAIPIRGNFREGLSVMEYFISSHGARKGLADTSLRTAESGHLTRRLVDVAQDVIVTEEDCGTCAGVLITEKGSHGRGKDEMRSSLIGRVLAESVDGLADLVVGAELLEAAVEQIVSAGVPAVRIRTPLTCEAKHGLCRKCYGRDLASGELVRVGAAVGIVAAQSIGEPGTQLTMRTFHTGGIAGAQGDITLGLPRVEDLFEARVPRDKSILSDIDGLVKFVGGATGGRSIVVTSTTAVCDEYSLPSGSRILVGQGDHVLKDQVIAHVAVSPGAEPVHVLARIEGTINCTTAGALAIEYEEREERPYPIPALQTIVVVEGQEITAGTPLTAGKADPQDILRIEGREAVQLYLVGEVQQVYRNTGVYIDNKHAEIIVRQMLRRLRIEHPGDTAFLTGELVDRFACAEVNARILAEGGEPAMARTVLLGITKASLTNGSWLAAASFQDTTRILTRAAVEAQTDHLVGLKENLMIGRLIPAGTGLEERQRRREARTRAALPQAEADGDTSAQGGEVCFAS